MTDDSNLIPDLHCVIHLCGDFQSIFRTKPNDGSPDCATQKWDSFEAIIYHWWECKCVHLTDGLDPSEIKCKASPRSKSKRTPSGTTRVSWEGKACTPGPITTVSKCITRNPENACQGSSSRKQSVLRFGAPDIKDALDEVLRKRWSLPTMDGKIQGTNCDCNGRETIIGTDANGHQIGICNIDYSSPGYDALLDCIGNHLNEGTCTGVMPGIRDDVVEVMFCKAMARLLLQQDNVPSNCSEVRNM